MNLEADQIHPFHYPAATLRCESMDLRDQGHEKAADDMQAAAAFLDAAQTQPSDLPCKYSVPSASMARQMAKGITYSGSRTPNSGRLTPAPASPIVSEAAPHDARLDTAIEFMGLALAVRPEAFEAVREAASSHEKVLMSSGVAKRLIQIMDAAKQVLDIFTDLPARAAAVSPIDGGAGRIEGLAERLNTVNHLLTTAQHEARNETMRDDAAAYETLYNAADEAQACLNQVLEILSAGPVSLSSEGGGGAGWVSVSERLPADRQKVLITRPLQLHSVDEHNAVHVGQHSNGSWYASGEDYDGDDLLDNTVTHWQPLPQAPTQSNDENR